MAQCVIYGVYYSHAWAMAVHWRSTVLRIFTYMLTLPMLKPEEYNLYDMGVPSTTSEKVPGLPPRSNEPQAPSCSLKC